MGFRFGKSIKLAPGVRLYITKKGISSMSVGKRGATVNVGKKGTRGTVGIPSSGLSYSSYKAHDRPLRSKTRSSSPHSPVNSVDQLIIGHTEKKVGCLACYRYFAIADYFCLIYAKAGTFNC